MTEIYTDVRFLSAADLDTLGLTMAEIVGILEEAFRVKATGDVMMPPKIFFHRHGPRFYSSMVSASPDLGYAGCKWQNGDPENPGRALPYIQGLYILTEDATGQMRAIMDAEWITGNRTAAASGLVVKHLARSGAATLGILGCGLQGRKHLEAIHAVRPDIEHCVCYDLHSDRQQQFIEEMTGKFGHKIDGATDAEEVVTASDVLITGGPIMDKRDPVIEPGWIKSGALVVTIDYDSYVTDAAIQAMDLIITDDQGQIEDARRNEGKFPGVTRIDATVADLVAHGTGRRTSDDQRILAFNLGIALEDLATGIEILHRAEQSGIGTPLPLRSVSPQT